MDASVAWYYYTDVSSIQLEALLLLLPGLPSVAAQQQAELQTEAASNGIYQQPAAHADQAARTRKQRQQ